MADDALAPFSTEQLLSEVQIRTSGGVACVAFHDSSSKHYLWWGERPAGLAMAARLLHILNTEIDDLEVDTDYPTSMTDPPEPAANPAPETKVTYSGMYL